MIDDDPDDTDEEGDVPDVPYEEGDGDNIDEL